MIKRLNVLFKKITSDQFTVIDLSEYIVPVEGVDAFLDLKIKTPSKEAFFLKLPVGKAQHFSSKDKNVVSLKDGQYSVSLEDGSLEVLKGFYPEMEDKINTLILKTKSLDFFREIQDKFHIMKILDEHGDTKSAEIFYEDIADLLGKCGVDKRTC